MTDRAVSSTLNYVLSLAIATLLVTGLFIAGGDFVDDRRTNVIRSELQVVGQQVAADAVRADRMISASDSASSATVRINQSLPPRVVGASYRVWFVPASGPSDPERIVLNTTDPEVTVTVVLNTDTDLQESQVRGGNFVIRRIMAGTSKLEVTDA